ncbi:MAG: ABC transporter substrate-binding protein [Bilifractor sp.]|jgi:peptide/nickel transport system substrate-binding protein
MKKRITAMALTVAMMVVLTACGDSSGADAVQSGSLTSTVSGSGKVASTSSSSEVIGDALSINSDPVNTETTDKTLVICLMSEPSNLWDAGMGTTQNENEIIGSCLRDNLVTKDPATGEVIPNLATDWKWIDDTHLQFTLRDDVKFMDGSTMTADDIVYNVETWIQNSPATDTGRYLSGAVADDDTHVTIAFNTKAPALLDMLTWDNFGIVGKNEVDALGGVEAAAKNPLMGSGKYIFKEWKNGESITIERNDNYWNKDYKGYYKEIVFKFINDAASRELAVESGDAQVGYQIPVSQASTYVSNEKVAVVAYTTDQVVHLWYNMTEGHTTSDLKVRQAIAKALNYDAIASVGTAGFGGQAYGFFPEDNKYYQATYSKEEKTRDVEGAKKILEDAGYATDGSLQLSILGAADNTPVYTIIQENLREIGITVNLNIVDIATFVQEAFGGDYDMIAVGDYVENRFPSVFNALQQANIDSGFIIGGTKVTTPEIDEGITNFISTTDDSDAKKYSGSVEDMIKENCMESELYPEYMSSVVGKNIKGYTAKERGFIDPTTLYEVD